MTATIIRLITGVQSRWVGETAPEESVASSQCVYFANHTSNLDGPVIWASLPASLRKQTRPIAARDYWEGGLFRRYLAKKVFNCVLIERKKVTKSNNPMQLMEQALDEGSSLIIFPEGGRTGDEDAEMSPFKSGIYHLARHRPGLKFVPVYLENLNRILPKGEFILIPLIATARFGSPITLEENEDKDAFLTRARDAVLALDHAGENNA